MWKQGKIIKSSACTVGLIQPHSARSRNWSIKIIQYLTQATLSCNTLWYLKYMGLTFCIISTSSPIMCMCSSIQLWAIKMSAYEKPICKWVPGEISTHASGWLNLKIRLWQHIPSLRGKCQCPQLRTYPQSPPECSKIEWFCWSSEQVEN